MESRDKTTLNDSSEDINSFSKQEQVTENTGGFGKGEQPDADENQQDSESEKFRQEAELYKDKYLRLFAEFENYKRRSAKERLETIQTAGREVLISLLEVVDDCDRAEKQMNTSSDVKDIRQGVQLVFNKLKNTLQSRGLRAMESIGTDFDVEKHEAVSEIEVADKAQKGKVIDEIMKGYYLNDKLIRFAKVIVGK